MLHIHIFALDLCPKENKEDSGGWKNNENMFCLNISDSQMNSAITIVGLMSGVDSGRCFPF